jgi:hypothetical protein
MLARIVGHTSLAMIDHACGHLTPTDDHEALVRSLMGEGGHRPSG